MENDAERGEGNGPPRKKKVIAEKIKKWKDQRLKEKAMRVRKIK